jgi:peptidoglycan/xylan/chitin deacetylase (PgdA/CDA1 family)
MYHSISRLEDDPNRLCTSPEKFELQMRYLKRRGLQGVSMRELCRSRDAGFTKGLVGLTFDDGYQDFLHNALPVLESLGFTATVFVISDMLGSMNNWAHHHEPKPQLPLLRADEVREVSERGMEVGSHTVNHAWLPGLQPELLQEEVSSSRHTLSELLGQTVEGFCYPYGGVDSKVIEAVRGTHYDYGCSIFARVAWSVYDLPRIDVAERDMQLMLAAKLRLHSQYHTLKRVYHATKNIYARGHDFVSEFRQMDTRGRGRFTPQGSVVGTSALAESRTSRRGAADLEVYRCLIEVYPQDTAKLEGLIGRNVSG